VRVFYKYVMIIGKSEIEWHNINELPREKEDLLILAADKYLMGVYCGQYEHGELGFHIPDDEFRHDKITNVLGWAYFPIVHIVTIDRKEKLKILELH
jgi:hypothetical protein